MSAFFRCASPDANRHLERAAAHVATKLLKTCRLWAHLSGPHSPLAPFGRPEIDSFALQNSSRRLRNRSRRLVFSSKNGSNSSKPIKTPLEAWLDSRGKTPREQAIRLAVTVDGVRSAPLVCFDRSCKGCGLVWLNGTSRIGRLFCFSW